MDGVGVAHGSHSEGPNKRSQNVNSISIELDCSDYTQLAESIN